MNALTAFFYAFSAILIFAGLRVVTARNPVHSALYLVLAFFSASALWMLLEAEFAQGVRFTAWQFAFQQFSNITQGQRVNESTY